MRVNLVAIGRLKAGAERTLFDRYLDRAAATGRAIGLTPTAREIAEARAAGSAERRDREAASLLGLVPANAVLVALDEKGRDLDSAAFAARLGRWRDDGVADVVLAIGGPDGHGAALLDRADLRLAFGSLTWPHQLVRVMLAEQVYRAACILAGHPYHRA